MSVRSQTFTITDTADRIDNEGRRSSSVWVHNGGDATVYLGGEAVSAADGMPVAASEHASLGLGADDALYAVCDTGESADIRVLEVDA